MFSHKKKKKSCLIIKQPPVFFLLPFKPAFNQFGRCFTVLLTAKITKEGWAGSPPAAGSPETPPLSHETLGKKLLQLSCNTHWAPREVQGGKMQLPTPEAALGSFKERGGWRGVFLLLLFCVAIVVGTCDMNRGPPAVHASHPWDGMF